MHFPQLLGRLTPPLGVRGLRLDSSQLLEYMRALQIPDRGGRMHFQEVLYALCARSGGVELPPCALQDGVETPTPTLALALTYPKPYPPSSTPSRTAWSGSGRSTQRSRASRAARPRSPLPLPLTLTLTLPHNPTP